MRTINNKKGGKLVILLNRACAETVPSLHMANSAECSECGKPSHFEAVCRQANRQQVGFRGQKSAHEVRQEDKPQPMKQDQQERSFDSVRVKYMNFYSVKCVKFTNTK